MKLFFSAHAHFLSNWLFYHCTPRNSSKSVVCALNSDKQEEERSRAEGSWCKCVSTLTVGTQQSSSALKEWGSETFKGKCGWGEGRESALAVCQRHQSSGGTDGQKCRNNTILNTEDIKWGRDGRWTWWEHGERHWHRHARMREMWQQRHEEKTGRVSCEKFKDGSWWRWD